MLTLLFATARHENLRQELARIAIDHGLCRERTYLFEGDITPYRHRCLVDALRHAVKGRHGYRVDCFAMTPAAAKRRAVLQRP